MPTVLTNKPATPVPASVTTAAVTPATPDADANAAGGAAAQPATPTAPAAAPAPDAPAQPAAPAAQPSALGIAAGDTLGKSLATVKAQPGNQGSRLSMNELLDQGETLSLPGEASSAGSNAATSTAGSAAGTATAPAAPVQNIGAYGQEVASAIAYVDVYDTRNDTFTRLQNAECEFSYRHSIFRGREQGRYIITAVTMRLRTVLPQPPFYKAIETYLREHSIANPSVRQLRDAVVAIRANKLPDPRTTPNTGSFFKNAIVSREVYERIVADYPNAPHYDLPDGNVKIPTGWLIEQSGLKGALCHMQKIETGPLSLTIHKNQLKIKMVIGLILKKMDS